ncbi:MAG: hypothetical protein JXB44_07980 [Calditrichaceae bacterium]|nr:hypothetical protein [Calditrichaceae bacterium]RQV95109.1 MAG: hypothetical protein EH224_08465 [Calditrichota bacterium]
MGKKITLLFGLSLFIFGLLSCDSSTSPKKVDPEINFTNVYWSDAVDADGDDYASTARLNFETKADKNMDIYILVGVRYAAEEDTAKYLIYFQSTVYNTELTDAKYVNIGLPNTELPHGSFDFVIQIFSEDNTEDVKAEANIKSYPTMQAVLFEPQAEDALPVMSVSPSSLNFGTSTTSIGFTISNTGGGTLNWTITDDQSWLSVSQTSGSTAAGNTSNLTASVDRSELSAGDYSGTITITPNAGSSYTINVSMTVEDALPVMSVSPASLDFGTTTTSMGFTISNTGGGTLNWTIPDDQSWLSVSQTSGSTTAGNTSNLTADVRRNSLSAGNYSGAITITPNAGSNYTITVSMEVEEETGFTLVFKNPLFTNIDVTPTGKYKQTIVPGDSAVYYYDSNPGTVGFLATTCGKTTGGDQIGLLMEWDYSGLDVSGLVRKSYNLVLNSSYFFIYMRNNGGANLAPLYVNYGRTEQTMDNIVIPNDNVNYRTGYYQAFTNTQVRMYFQGLQSYVYWNQGTHFTLPWTQNQYVYLYNSNSPGSPGVLESPEEMPKLKAGGHLIPEYNIPQNTLLLNGENIEGKAAE